VQIKLLQMVNRADPEDNKGIVRLQHFFYWREHLVLATELLHLNLFQALRRAARAPERYFTMQRIKAIAIQVRLCCSHRMCSLHCSCSYSVARTGAR
jgi:dual specificity tyrosine-phosphorylation-regulated kinase 2/3/4